MDPVALPALSPPPALGCWDLLLASQGPPTLDHSNLGYSETPEVRGTQLRVHGKVSKNREPGQPRREFKILEALTSSPTPFRKHKRSKERKKKERGQKKQEELEDLSHHQHPACRDDSCSPRPPAFTFPLPALQLLWTLAIKPNLSPQTEQPRGVLAGPSNHGQDPFHSFTLHRAKTL